MADRAPRDQITRHVGRLSTAVLTLLGIVAMLGGCASSASPAGSGSPAVSITPSGGSIAASPDGSSAPSDLAATIPTQVGDVKLTVASGDLTQLKDEVPNYTELVQQLSNASIQPADVLGAVGTPTDGGDSVRVSGIQVTSVPPGGIGMQGFLTAWLQTVPNATPTGTNVGGKPVTQVTFTDGSAPLYYYMFDLTPLDSNDSDTLYFVRTADEALATSAFEQLPPATS